MSATVAAPSTARPARHLPDSRLSDEVVAAVADAALGTDGGRADLRPLLRRLAADGRTDLGLPGAAGDLAEQVAVVERLARECVSSAFTVWAHRMATEYVVVHGGAALAALAGELRTAARPGASAMASAFRDVAGIAPMPITFRRDGADVVLDGFIPWASNLYDDAVVVTTAREESAVGDAGAARIVVALPVATPGLRVRPADPLLALDSTRSGSASLTGVRVPSHQIVTDDLAGFVAAIRPAFLCLQSSFCLGLGGAALDAAPSPTGVAVTLAPEHERLLAERGRIERELLDLVAAAGTPGQPEPSAYLQVRLDAALFAGDATRLELCLAGGRGYVRSSSTARRVREALFLPIQSPTESQLRWELSRSA